MTLLDWDGPGRERVKYLSPRPGNFPMNARRRPSFAAQTTILEAQILLAIVIDPSLLYLLAHLKSNKYGRGPFRPPL